MFYHINSGKYTQNQLLLLNFEEIIAFTLQLCFRVYIHTVFFPPIGYQAATDTILTLSAGQANLATLHPQLQSIHGIPTL